MSSKFMYFFLQWKKFQFLMKTFQDLYSYSELQLTPNGWRSKIQFQWQLQTDYNDTRRWIRVLSSEIISHLKNKNKHVYAL